MVLLLGMSAPALAVLVCGTPGSAGVGNLSGIINDYWAGSGNRPAGSTSLTLGSRRSPGGPATGISAGDLVMIIQMQDADINTSNTATYGTTTVNNAGRYEYVKATNTASAGGTLTFTPALTYSYRTRNFGTSGQSRWQVIRVPQYASATTVGTVTAPSWDGNTGAVVAMDIENNLALSSPINVDGLGFRGGLGRLLGGAAGSNTDYRTLASTATNASKGEGIAGTPRYINDTTAYNAAPNATDTGVEGYPNGSYARGAPANAGGGGTDGDPNANDENTGGGGGSNYGIGGQGGNAWSWTPPAGDFGGKGGAPFNLTLAANRVFLGGGGGAGTTNNGTSDNAVYLPPTYVDPPPGLACTAGAGNCSSGAAGGGIVLIRAGSISGGSAISARGADGYNVENDGAGGGGGGGTVMLQTYFGGNATVDVSGGNGGNAWRSHTVAIDRHGPGGGGGGGFIAYSPSSGFTVNATYAAGVPGRTSLNQTFGSTSGDGGFTTYDLPNVPGVQPGTFCPPAIKAATLAIDNGTAGAIDSGDTIEYTVVYRNGSSGTITGFNITDPLPANMTYVPSSLSVTTSGGTSGSANSTYDGTSTTTLLASNVSLPAGGIITARLRGVASGPICSNILNQANSVQNSGQDVLGLSDNADSTQNEGGLPSGTYIDQSPYGTGGTDDPTGITMACPNLSTSTKSWTDLNGGDQNPDDVLRYTITITDSGGGEATGVTVTDDMPANINSFTVVTPLPAGAVNNSLPTGGANGTGYLDISNITVPANGSVTIQFEVTIDSVPAGTAIDNTATITNPLGPGGTPSAPQVIVSSSSIPSSGTKQLYMQTVDNENSPTEPQDLSRTPLGTPTFNRVRLRGNRNNEVPWDLTPVLQAPLSLNANSLVVLQAIDEDYGAQDVRITISYDNDNNPANGQTILATQDFPNMNFANVTPTTYTFTLATLAVVIPAGNTLRLTVRNLETTSDRFFIYPYTSSGTSRVELNSATVINVDSIDFYSDVAYPGGTVVTSLAPGDWVRIRSTISDPFGTYDLVTPATITVTDPLGTVTVNQANMVEVFDSTVATKVYEYRYQIPTAGPGGNWDIRVDAVEGTEAMVSDFGLDAIPVVVPMPLLTIMKSASVANASPGTPIIYTVTVVNTGTGAAANVVLTDKLSPYSAFALNSYGPGIAFASAPPSVLLDPPEYFDGTDWLYVPSSGGGGAPPGYDSNIKNWRISLTDSLPAGDSFTLNYQTIVK